MLRIDHHRHLTSFVLTFTFRRVLVAAVATVVLALAHPRERDTAAIVAPELALGAHVWNTEAHLLMNTALSRHHLVTHILKFLGNMTNFKCIWDTNTCKSVVRSISTES